MAGAPALSAGEHGTGEVVAMNDHIEDVPGMVLRGSDICRAVYRRDQLAASPKGACCPVCGTGDTVPQMQFIGSDVK